MSWVLEAQARTVGRPRRWLLLDPAEATFAKRGFRGALGKRDHFESIGAHFIAGYNTAIVCREPESILATARCADASLLGFVIEGAAMGVALCDGLLPGRRRLPEFLEGTRSGFRYLVHVGVGWAIARLPWYRNVLRSRLDRDITPLADDGWGFHDAYFNLARVLKRASGSHIHRTSAYYQGVGRALWFATGAAPASVAALLNQFPAGRHPDLWAGVGLASGYAGGATAQDLHDLQDFSGAHRPWLIQGAAFAAEARVVANCIPPHTQLVCAAWIGTTAESCANHVRHAKAANTLRGRADEYEGWRATTAQHFAGAQLELAR